MLNGGTHFIYTNDPIPLLQPPLSKVVVRLHEDYRFGPHDINLWPQAFVPNAPHLACIRKRSDNEKYPFAQLWWDPTKSSFVAVPGVIQGLGALEERALAFFEEIHAEMDARVDAFKKTNQATPSKHSQPVFLCHDFLKTLYDRLNLTRLTYEQMRVTVVAYQRTYLETLAALDWAEVFGPKAWGLQPVREAPPLNQLMGVFVWAIEDAERFKKAGVPHWRIAPADEIEKVAIHELAPLVQPNLSKPILHRDPVYQGPISTQLYKNIVAFTQNAFKTSNPFNVKDTPSATPASSSSTATAVGTSTGQIRRANAKPCKCIQTALIM